MTATLDQTTGLLWEMCDPDVKYTCPASSWCDNVHDDIEWPVEDGDHSRTVAVGYRDGKVVMDVGVGKGETLATPEPLVCVIMYLPDLEHSRATFLDWSHARFLAEAMAADGSCLGLAEALRAGARLACSLAGDDSQWERRHACPGGV